MIRINKKYSTDNLLDLIDSVAQKNNIQVDTSKIKWEDDYTYIVSKDKKTRLTVTIFNYANGVIVTILTSRILKNKYEVDDYKEYEFDSDNEE